MQSGRTLLAAVVVTAIFGCAGTGDPAPTQPPAAVEKDIGVTGGKLEIAGHATLDVRPNAALQPVHITMSVVETPRVAIPGDAVSSIISLTPHGTTFNLPVRLSLSYDPSAPLDTLVVYRLADDSATEWVPVGGVNFDNGVASFETMGFSSYGVAKGRICTSPYAPVACSSTCNCCGGLNCVTLDTSANCGACGVTCSADQFCSSSSTCASSLTTKLCENSNLVVIQGELPKDAIVAYEQTTDGKYAAEIAGVIKAECGLTVQTVSQATLGVLDPCTNAPVIGGGKTLLVVGGDYGQRVARYLDAGLAPVYLTQAANGDRTFRSRGGSAIVTFPESYETDSHDYFAISMMTDPSGTLIFYLYGIGWEGTPAGTWYFKNVVYPEMKAGTRTWSKYLVVEWTDDGDLVKDAGDTWTILAQDTP